MILPARPDGCKEKQQWAKVVVDQEVGERFLAEFPGRKLRVNPSGYVYSDLRISRKLRKVYLHRWIMGAPDGLDVDHINGDKLDNRRENLQLCTRGQNMMKARKRRGSKSKYRGVSWNTEKGLWQAQININGKSKLLGRYKDDAEAARVYDVMAREIYGSFASLNFPEESHGHSQDRSN